MTPEEIIRNAVARVQAVPPSAWKMMCCGRAADQPHAPACRAGGAPQGIPVELVANGDAELDSCDRIVRALWEGAIHRLGDEAAGLVPLPKKSEARRVIPAFPVSTYAALVK